MPLANIDAYLAGGQLPALTPIESAVARAWLIAHQAEYDRVEFNVRLGDGIQLPPGSPEFMQRFARAATTKRADLILYRGTVATIVEVKIRIGASAIGQLTTYRLLLMQARPDLTAVNMIAAGQTIEPDINAIMTGQAIGVELFPLAA
jgi:hypothetical protein